MSAVYLQSLAFEHAGIPGLVLIGRGRSFHPIYGRTMEFRYQGKPEAIQQAINRIPTDQSYQTQEEGPIHFLTVTQNDSDRLNSYEIPGNALQRDIREHPLSLALGYSTIQAIDKLLNDEDATTSDSTLLSTLGSANAVDLYKMLRQRRGQFAFNVSQFVFRVTTITNLDLVVDIAYSNVNKAFSFNALIDETNPPTGFVTALTAIHDNNNPGAQSGYAWAWLKQTPSVTQAPGNKLSIQIEYWLELWPTQYYALVDV